MSAGCANDADLVLPVNEFRAMWMIGEIGAADIGCDSTSFLMQKSIAADIEPPHAVRSHVARKYRNVSEFSGGQYDDMPPEYQC